MTKNDKNTILARLASKEISVEEASKLLDDGRTDITKPRRQKDGKLCVMPGLTLTAYQLARILAIQATLIALVKEDLPSKARVEHVKSSDPKRDDYDKHFAGLLLVAYKPEHVEFAKEFFAGFKVAA